MNLIIEFKTIMARNYMFVDLYESAESKQKSFIS